LNNSKIKDQIIEMASSLYHRGYSFGSSGNISVKTDTGFIMTPTGSSMADLKPSELSVLDAQGNLLSGHEPTKESFLHMAMYEQRSKAKAVVHLHCSHSSAVSCMQHGCTENVLPPLTAYYVMRIGILPLIPYFAPGDINLAQAVKEKASKSHALLLANHGPVVAGTSLKDAIYATEELEETAKLYLMLKNMETQPLTPEAINELNKKYPKKI
jgi:3-dehydro-4-phosphotetronate decarboxylase